MNKTKILVVSVVALMLVNVALIVSLMVGNSTHIPPHRNEQGPKYIIIERLHFSNEQVADYEKLIEMHRQQIREQEEKIRLAKNELFGSLKNNNYPEKDSLIELISQTQKSIENIHFNHFNDVKNLCTSEQIENFNALSDDLAKLFAPHPPKPRK